MFSLCSLRYKAKKKIELVVKYVPVRRKSNDKWKSYSWMQQIQHSAPWALTILLASWNIIRKCNIFIFAISLLYTDKFYILCIWNGFSEDSHCRHLNSPYLLANNGTKLTQHLCDPWWHFKYLIEAMNKLYLYWPWSFTKLEKLGNIFYFSYSSIIIKW